MPLFLSSASDPGNSKAVADLLGLDTDDATNLMLQLRGKWYDNMLVEIKFVMDLVAILGEMGYFTLPE